MKKFLLRVCNFFLDLIYPHLCFCCGRRLRKEEKYLCLRCSMEVTPATHIVEEKELSFKGRVLIDHLFSLYKFHKESAIQTIIHHFKYKKKSNLAVYMGERMGEYLATHFEEVKFDFIVPIPLHPKKERERGYNQSEKLSQGISRVLHIPVRTDFLRRTHYTKTQTHLEYEERYKNVQGIFCVEKGEELVGRHILLVDDVFTSGSTLESASKEILSIKGVHLSLFTLAMV